MPKIASTLLATSARGASVLILLQTGSRALTFIVNQILLRYSSPELLGISSQLELYSISVLYFARESLRVALQRQRPQSEAGRDGGSQKADSDACRAQEVVNLSYVAVLSGPLFAAAFAVLYLRKVDPVVLSTPHVHLSLFLFALAAILELLAEPCFVVAQQQMLYGIRASAETLATLTRCSLTCAITMWASISQQKLGVFPFAIGQLGYAIVLAAVYYGKIWGYSTREGFSLRPRSLRSERTKYVLSLLHRPTLTLAINLYAQSGLKHLLTQGDSVLMTLFASLSSQGVYALSSNYGSLLARLLFQPIEESSRGVFGRFLVPASSSVSEENTPKDQHGSRKRATWDRHSASSPTSPAANGSIVSARSYLVALLHLYALLSLVIIAIGPTAAPILLRFIAGPAWASAGSVLATYCYYIPLLALNGILEAFVSATATPAQLRTQSAWMVAFSAGFAASGFLLLMVFDLGATGLVAANAVTMIMRIVWSWSFVTSFFGGQSVSVGPTDGLPDPRSIAVGVLVASSLGVLGRPSTGGFVDLVTTGAVGALYGLFLLYIERAFLYDCYLMIKPASEPPTAEPTKKNSQ